MRRACLAPVVALSLAACGGAHKSATTGSNRGDLIPSCYADARLDDARPAPAHAVFVVIDQTTWLDDKIRDTIRRSVTALMQRRGEVAIYTFSANDRDHYPTRIAAGTVEQPVDDGDRASLPAKRLERVDRCLGQQLEFAERAVRDKLDAATGDTTTQYSHSAIENGLTQISEAVRKSTARDKTVLIVSDLIEHSDIASFYQKHALRTIDPATELDRSRTARAIGDFDGARLIVIGAGLLPPEAARDQTRGSQALRALHDFWEQWFAASKAKLTDYGEPDLVNPV